MALPFLCAEIRYEMIGTKIYKLIKKLASDKSPEIIKNNIPCLAKIIKIYKEKSKKKKEKEDENEIKIDPGSVKNFLGIVEKFILDNQKIVREKIIECIGELVSSLDKEELSQKLFTFYVTTIDEFYYNKEIVPIKPQRKNSKKKDEKEEEGKKELEKNSKKFVEKIKKCYYFFFVFNFWYYYLNFIFFIRINFI